jgi:NADH:ubiquinone reductase (non-electrogenic)
MIGTNGSIFAIGDCTASSYAPTAQVASQQGAYLARMLALMAKRETLESRLTGIESEIGYAHSSAVLEGASGSVKYVTPKSEDERKKELEKEMERVMSQLEKVKLRPFHYSHQGSLA